MNRKHFFLLVLVTAFLSTHQTTFAADEAAAPSPKSSRWARVKNKVLKKRRKNLGKLHHVIAETRKNKAHRNLGVLGKRLSRINLRDYASHVTADQFLANLYERSAKSSRVLERVCNEIATEIEGTIVQIAPLKSMARVKEKAYSDYGVEVGDSAEKNRIAMYQAITDIVRGSLIFDDYTKLRHAMDLFNEKLPFINVKDRFANPVDGYRDVLANFKDNENNVIGEIQFHLRQIIHIKNTVGHALYEDVRTIEGKAKAENRELTPEEIEQVADLKARMTAVYNEAFEKAQSGG